MNENRIKLKAIVAMCSRNNGIGMNGTLPWKIPSDLKFFAHVTKYTRDKSKRNALLIGRKTWFSIPKQARPLQNRLNFIISNTITNKNELDFSTKANEDEIFIKKSLQDAIYYIRNELKDQVESIYVIGGSQIYREAFLHRDFDELFLTRINTSVECDTFLEPSDFLDSFSRVDDASELDADLISGFEMNTKLYEQNVEYIFEVYRKRI